MTNSSLQYVRDSIEEMYRIVAVVSMPQTAFSATGAGVKSSVLFLKKYTAKQTAKIKLLKDSLKDKTKKDIDFEKQVRKLEEQKKQRLKELDNTEIDGKKIDKKSEAYKEAREAINKEFAELLDNLKDSAIEIYKNSKAEELAKIDYDIFMAIAEDIGYDATGKPTNNNELDFIGKELSKFIEQIERDSK